MTKNKFFKFLFIDLECWILEFLWTLTFGIHCNKTFSIDIYHFKTLDQGKQSIYSTVTLLARFLG